MTVRRPSHSPADDDSDFLWQSTCGSDMSPCLAEPAEPKPSARRDSDRSLIRGDSMGDVSNSQDLESFELEGVDVPSSASEAHAIVERRARWRGAEIYSTPAAPGEAEGDNGASSAPAAVAAPVVPVIPPLVPLVATMLAAAVAFVVMVAMPGWFGSPGLSPAEPGKHAAAPSDVESGRPEVLPTKPAEKGPSDIAPPEVKMATELPANPPPTPSPIAAEVKPMIEPKVPPVVDAPVIPPAPINPPKAVVPPKPAVTPEQPPVVPKEISRLAPQIAEQRLSIARQLEVAGRYDVAMKRYQALADEFPNTNVGDEASARLKNLRDTMK